MVVSVKMSPQAATLRLVVRHGIACGRRTVAGLLRIWMATRASTRIRDRAGKYGQGRLASIPQHEHNAPPEPEPQPFILHRPFNTGLFFGLGLVIAAAAGWLTFIIIASLLGVVVALA